jgi:carbonic anhydrase
VVANLENMSNPYSDRVLLDLADSEVYRKGSGGMPKEPGGSLKTPEPYLAVMTCSDSRIIVPALTGGLAGDDFVKQGIANVAPPNEAGSAELKGFLAHVLENVDSIKALVVLGHTDCAGVGCMVDDVLSDVSKGHSSLSDLMMTLVTDDLRNATKDAEARGASPQEIREVTEYLVPLINTKNILEQELRIDGKTVIAGDIIAEKGIEIVPAMLNLQTENLELFTQNGYVPLGEMLNQISAKNASPEGYFIPEFAAGANVEEVAKISVKDIDSGIKDQLDKLLVLEDKSSGRG